MHSGEEVEVLQLTKPPAPEEKGWRHVVDGIIDFAAGIAGGTAGTFAGQPLDTVKVKMQTFPELYKNGVLCFRQTFQKDGIRGLYAGTTPALAANVAENSVLFAAYGVCQKAVAMAVGQSDVSQLNPFHNACAGSLAAVFSSFTLCPTELIKCKLQALREMQAINPASYSSNVKIGPLTIIKDILRQDGILGMFRGLAPTFAREVPGYFFFFGGYEISRRALTPAGKTKDEIGVVRTCLCGGLGGVCLWVAIFPADVVKSRVQIKGKGSLFGTMIDIFKNEGPRALYKGLGPTVVRTFIASGALFVAYEYTRKVCHAFF